MIVHALCNTCLQRFELRVQPGDAALLKQLADEHGLTQCPRLCGGKINLANPSNEAFRAMMAHPGLKDPVPLLVSELYKAVHGGGMPDEVPQSFELAAALFKAHPVESVFLEQDGSSIYLHEIRFGHCTLHLSAGRRGAQVLKITRT